MDIHCHSILLSITVYTVVPTSIAQSSLRPSPYLFYMLLVSSWGVGRPRKPCALEHAVGLFFIQTLSCQRRLCTRSLGGAKRVS